MEVIEKFPGSDHHSVSCTFRFDMPKKSSASSVIPKTERFDFRRADWHRYRCILSEVPWSSELADLNVDDMWNKIKSTIFNAANITTVFRNVSLPNIYLECL